MNDLSEAQNSGMSKKAEKIAANFQTTTEAIKGEVGKIIVGQDEVVESLLITLLVGGHCLITGMPGTAKTLLVRTLSEALGLSFKRIQFTPDLMPTDITGTDVIEEDPATGHRTWTFVQGPIFANVLLADEINRTPPKTQSAMLEAMQEASVTVRGNIHELPQPFFVLATQNPIEMEGTYTLPEAQLDRFLFNVLLDYLSADEEMDVLQRNTSGTELPEVKSCTNAKQILDFQWLVRQVPIEDAIAQQAVALVRATRPSDESSPESVKKYLKYGSSVRATQFITLAAKARALLHGRYHVTTEDLSVLAKPVLRHRVITNYFAESDGVTADQVLDEIISVTLK
jgi:MoxR-like ATPase